MNQLNSPFRVFVAFGFIWTTVVANARNTLRPTTDKDYEIPTILSGNRNWPDSTARAICPEDYFPCICAATVNGLEITCADVSIEDIRNVFFRTQTLRLYLIQLTVTASPSPVIALPADLFQDKKVASILLVCPPDASPRVGLNIDRFAFEFTRFETTRMVILNCDLSGQADMQFLNEFSALHTLRIENTFNVQVIETLPTSTLPALQKLVMTGCTGLEKAAFPDLTPARLERLYLNGNGLSDEAIQNILISVGSSSSSSSLQELVLANDGMTRVPTIGSFSQLGVYDVSYNNVSLMSPFSLIFSSAVRLVSLQSISLQTIEGEAFLGDFSAAQFNLEYNQLTEFREDVFKSVLQQMAALPDGQGGQVIVTGNPFTCGCGLAWLIRDNQNLVASVKNAICDGFFKFEDLNPNSFLNCL